MATLISALCAARSMFSHDWLRQMSGDYRSALEIIRNDIDYLLEPKEWEIVGEVVDPDEI